MNPGDGGPGLFAVLSPGQSVKDTSPVGARQIDDASKLQPARGSRSGLRYNASATLAPTYTLRPGAGSKKRPFVSPTITDPT